MLHRITAALSEFIAPISTSTRKDFQRDPSQNRKREREPAPKQLAKSAQVIQIRPSVTPPAPALPSAGDRQSASVSLGFIQLIALLNQQRTTFFRWFASKSYETALREQKKKHVFRRGTMLDRKAE